MRKRGRRSGHIDTGELLNQAGERLARQHDVPVDHVRYASYRFHNGQNWTIREGWEILRGNCWEPCSVEPEPAKDAGCMAWEESQRLRDKPR